MSEAAAKPAATPEPPKEHPKCCHIPCGRKADFYMREQGTTHADRPDAGDTFCCSGHLLDMLGSYTGEPLPDTTVSYVVTPLQ